MDWKFKHARGTSGGILIGLRYTYFSIVSWKEFKHCVVVIVKNITDDFVWRLVVVYGTPYEEFKVDFINELHEVMGGWQGPTILGGDFN
jgi:hypothetical protein